MNNPLDTMNYLLPNLECDNGRDVEKPIIQFSSDPSKKQKPKFYGMLRIVATGKPFNRCGRRSSHSTNATANSSSDEEEDQQRYPKHNQHLFLDKNIRSERQRKCVTFAVQGTARRTLSWREYSSEEIQATWYIQHEYMKIQKSCCKEIIKMDKGEALKDKKYCIRGLECHTRTGQILKTRNKQGSVQAVLAEQGSQIRDGRTRDDAAIALVYQKISSSCQLWARATGISDARAAEDVDDVLADKEAQDILSPLSPSSSRQHHPSSREFDVESDGGRDLPDSSYMPLPDSSCMPSMVARTA